MNLSLLLRLAEFEIRILRLVHSCTVFEDVSTFSAELQALVAEVDLPSLTVATRLERALIDGSTLLSFADALQAAREEIKARPPTIGGAESFVAVTGC